MRLVLGRGLRLAFVGVGLGLAASFALTRYLSSLLLGVTLRLQHIPQSSFGFCALINSIPAAPTNIIRILL
jgi:hypothetical protein